MSFNPDVKVFKVVATSATVARTFPNSSTLIIQYLFKKVNRFTSFTFHINKLTYCQKRTIVLTQTQTNVFVKGVYSDERTTAKSYAT